MSQIRNTDMFAAANLLLFIGWNLYAFLATCRISRVSVMGR